MARPRRTYTAEFKAEAVRLVTEQATPSPRPPVPSSFHKTLLRSWK